ncbi:MAG: helix-turn-helix transcriptional regulator [Tenericutes bacterium]|nr:helix-turn-helix transcriptional regulator [Mycoplasmatota bacterium]
MKQKTANILKVLRKNSSYTQLEVAEFLGVSRQAYSRYESNLREPNMETLSNISRFYNVSPQVFYIYEMDDRLDPNINIIETVARYQLKSTIYQDSDINEDSDLSRDFPKQDKEQIQGALSNSFDVDTKPKKHITFRRKIFKYVFLILISLFVTNIGIMTLHRKDSDYQYSILKHSYISAIAQNQNINQTMYLDIVKMYEFNPNNIEVGDYVVIYFDFGLNEYFIEKVVQVNEDAQTILTTYDNETTTTTQFTDIIGVYEKDANILGTIYYTSKFNTGYLLLVLSHIILLAIYYHSFIDIKKN